MIKVLVESHSRQEKGPRTDRFEEAWRDQGVMLALLAWCWPWLISGRGNTGSRWES